MTTVNKSFTPSDIFQGPADIYLGVTNPVSANPPVEGTNTLTLDSLGQPPVGSTGRIATGTLGATGSGGSGYVAGETLLVVSGVGVGGIVRVVTVSSGAVATLKIINGGYGYGAFPNTTTVSLSGAGTGATFTISTITAGYHLGLTEGPASLSINPKFDQITADQFSAPVDAAFVSAACEIDFVVKEFQLAMMSRMFAGIFSSNFHDLSAGSTNPATELIQIGSSPSSQARTTSVMLVAPQRTSPGKFLYALGYKAYLKGAFQMSVSRTKDSPIKLKFGLLADTSRVATDMAMQIVRQN